MHNNVENSARFNRNDILTTLDFHAAETVAAFSAKQKLPKPGA
jgi:hypothetical protein